MEEAKPAAAAGAPSGGRAITMEEVEKHNNEESCWFVHEGKVRCGMWTRVGWGGVRSSGPDRLLLAAPALPTMLTAAAATALNPHGPEHAPHACSLPLAPQVYDATPFLEEHPGGPDSIVIVGGQDATEDFNAIHSAKVGGQAVSPWDGTPSMTWFPRLVKS